MFVAPLLDDYLLLKESRNFMKKKRILSLALPFSPQQFSPVCASGRTSLTFYSPPLLTDGCCFLLLAFLRAVFSVLLPCPQLLVAPGTCSSIAPSPSSAVGAAAATYFLNTRVTWRGLPQPFNPSLFSPSPGGGLEPTNRVCSVVNK